MPVLFAAASSFDRKYEKSMSEGNRENALIYIRSAESLDTFNADYKVNMQIAFILRRSYERRF